MNFFDAQDSAKRATRWLVIVYVIATILIVAGVTAIAAAAFLMIEDTGQPVNSGFLGLIAFLAALLIIGATLFKTAKLSSGGGQVAVDLGGTLISTDVNNPLRRRFRNVVEEMAIASGLPKPRIVVIETEAMNAFATGMRPERVALGVTRGLLTKLTRAELQGVIGHEMGHIANWDTRYMTAVGILVGLIALVADAGAPQLTALVAAWNVFAFHRTLAMELPVMGRYFVTLRLASSVLIPPLAGLTAILLTGGFAPPR